MQASTHNDGRIVIALDNVFLKLRSESSKITTLDTYSFYVPEGSVNEFKEFMKFSRPGSMSFYEDKAYRQATILKYNGEYLKIVISWETLPEFDKKITLDYQANKIIIDDWFRNILATNSDI